MKKVLSVVLILTLICSLFSLPVMAEEVEIDKYTANTYADIPFGTAANSHAFEPHGTTIEGIDDPASELYTTNGKDYIYDYMQTYWYNKDITMGVDSEDSADYTWAHHPIYYRTSTSFGGTVLSLDENSSWTVPFLDETDETVKYLTYNIKTDEKVIKLVGPWNSTYQKLTDKAKEAYSAKNLAMRNATIDIANDNFKNIYILASKGRYQNGAVAPQYFTADVYYEGEETPVNVQIGLKKANVAAGDAEYASVASVFNKITETTNANSYSYPSLGYAAESTWYSYEIPCDVAKKVDKIKFNVSLSNCNIIILSALGEKQSIKDLVDSIKSTEVDALTYASQSALYNKIKTAVEEAELNLQEADAEGYEIYSALESNIKAYENSLIVYPENKVNFELNGNAKLFVDATSDDYINRVSLTGFLPGLDYAGVNDNPTGDFATDKAGMRGNADSLSVFQYTIDAGTTNDNRIQSGITDFTTGEDGKVYWNINGIDYPVDPLKNVIKVVAGPVTTNLTNSTTLDAETKAELIEKYSTLTDFTFDVKDGNYTSLSFLAGIANSAATIREVTVTFVYDDNSEETTSMSVAGSAIGTLTRAQGGVFFHRMTEIEMSKIWGEAWHTFAPYTVTPNSSKKLTKVKLTPVIASGSGYRYPIYILSAWGEGKNIGTLIAELSAIEITDAESANVAKAKLEEIDSALASANLELRQEDKAVYDAKKVIVEAYERELEAEKEKEKLDKNEYKDIPFGDAANSHVFEVYGTTIDGIDDPTSELYTSGSKDYVLDYAQNYWYDANKQKKLGVDSTDGDLYTWTHKPVYYKKTSTHSQNYIPLDENNNWTLPYLDGENVKYLTYNLKPDQKVVSMAGGFLSGYQQMTEKATEKYASKQATLRKAVIDVDNDNYNNLYMLLTTGVSGTGTAPENFTAEIFYEGEQETKTIELGLLRNNLSSTEDSITAKLNAITNKNNDQIWDYTSSVGYASAFGWYTYEIPCDVTKKVDKIVLRISVYNKYVILASMLGEKPSVTDALNIVETTEITPVTYKDQLNKLGLVESAIERSEIDLELADEALYNKYSQFKGNIAEYEANKHTLAPMATVETSFYKNETPFANVNIFNPSEMEGKPYTFIFAYYDEKDNYLGADVKPMTTTNKESYTFTHKAEKSFDGAKKVKSFVWESFATLKPISEKAETEETNAFKVLSIGNSFSQGVHTYLAEFAKEAGYEKIITANLYIGGCSLDKHYTNIVNNKAEYEFGIWELKDGKIHKNQDVTPTTTMLEGITYTDWDVITIQQNCAYSGVADKYTKLDAVLDYIYENKTNKNAKIGWHMTWAAREDSSVLTDYYQGRDQIDMYNDIVECMKSKIEPNDRIDFIIPAGTAVQNARAVYGDVFNTDEKHLTPKGNAIACLTWLAKLTGNDLSDITYMLDEYTPEEAAALKKAALDAIENPYVVTK